MKAYVKTNDKNMVLSVINEPTEGFIERECYFEDNFPVDENNPIYIDDGKEVRISISEEQKLNEYKLLTIKLLNPITTYRIENGSVELNNKKYTYDKYAKDNYTKLGIISADGNMEGELLSFANDYMEDELSDNDFKVIRALIAKNEFSEIFKHRTAVTNIMKSGTIEEINVILKDYKNA